MIELQSVALLRGLRRETADSSFIPVIDGLRFVAIMGVVMFHLHGYVTVKTGRSGGDSGLGLLMSQGYIGVQLFFAISGFIIARPFLNGTAPGLARYFMRRLTRLEPPYLINLFIVYVLLVVVLQESASELFPHLLASIFYVHNVIFGGMSKINFLAWSLEVEFQFYLLAPLFLAVLAALGARGRRVALFFVVLAGGWVYQADPLAGLGLGAAVLRYVAFFAAGILAADVYVNMWHETAPASVPWDCAALIGWSGALAALLSANGSAIALVPWCLWLAILGSIAGKWSNRILGWPPVYLIGGMCYTLYLYHFLIISAVGRIVLPLLSPAHPLWLDLLIAGVVVVPAILLVGTMLFLTTEKPFMRWRRERPSIGATPFAGVRGV